jgi:hypothetical protein
LIILLSGNGKYSLEGTFLFAVEDAGKTLFSLLMEGEKNDQEFTSKLIELHEFVKKNGIPVEADLILPPLHSNPGTMRAMLGLQKKP